MRTHRHSGPIAVLVTLALTGKALADPFVVICNTRSKPSQLTKAEVKALFIGKTKTLGGEVALVVVRGEGDGVFDAFADGVFGVSAKTLLSKIKQEVFKGEMARPIKASSDDEVVKAVAGAAGTIGVVSVAASKALPAGVVAIAVGG